MRICAIALPITFLVAFLWHTCSHPLGCWIISRSNRHRITLQSTYNIIIMKQLAELQTTNHFSHQTPMPKMKVWGSTVCEFNRDPFSPSKCNNFKKKSVYAWVFCFVRRHKFSDSLALNSCEIYKLEAGCVCTQCCQSGNVHGMCARNPCKLISFVQF